MALLNTIIDGGFNPESIDDSPSFQSTPDGVYIAEVEKAEIIVGDDGSTILEVQYRLMQNEAGEEFKSCSWEKFALQHQIESRQKWGQIFFKRLVDNAISPNYKIQDTDELIGKFVKITLKTSPSKADPTKTFQNVSDVKPANSAPAQTQSTPAPAVSAPAQPASASMPWQNK